MSQVAKFELAMRLLKELQCPQEILEALYWWGILVKEDEIKLHNWESLSDGNTVEGEAHEI